MEWTEAHDLILAKEVRASEPWMFKPRTVDRGKVWNVITDRLNDETSVKFQVKKKNVQEHFKLLLDKFKAKRKHQAKLSGVDIEDSEMDILMEEILLITFKILNFLAPTYLSSLISHRLPSKYNLRNSSDKFLLSYPRFKSKATLGDRSFTCAAPKLWNVLPFDIRSASTVSSFKAKLKTHLFRRAFLT